MEFGVFDHHFNRFAFGDLSHDETSRSLALFVSKVMPRLKETHA